MILRAWREDLARINRFRQSHRCNTIEALKTIRRNCIPDLERKYELDLRKRSIRLQQTKDGAACYYRDTFITGRHTFVKPEKLRRAVKSWGNDEGIQILAKTKSEEQPVFQEVRLQIKAQWNNQPAEKEISNDSMTPFSSQHGSPLLYRRPSWEDVNKGYNLFLMI